MTKQYRVRPEKADLYEQVAEQVSQEFNCDYLKILGVLHKLDRKVQEVRMD